MANNTLQSFRPKSKHHNHRQHDSLLQLGKLTTTSLHNPPSLVSSVLTNNPGLPPFGGRDDTLRAPHRPTSIHHETEALHLHLGESDSSQGAVCVKNNVHIHPHPVHRQCEPRLPRPGRAQPGQRIFRSRVCITRYLRHVCNR